MEKIYENPLKLLANKKSSTNRVKSYLKAYSSSSLLSTRSDFKPAKIVKEEFTLRSYQTRNQLSTKEDKRKQAEEAKQRADLLYDISVAKSDKLEIWRDLSTYEFELSNQVNLSNRLEILNSHLGTLPQLFSKFEGISNENKEISELIHQGLNDLNSIQNTKVPYELTREKFQTKEYNTSRKMKLLYKAIKQISGTRVLISIKGDTFLENFLVSIITRNCEVCLNVPIKLDILAVDTLNQSVEIIAAVEQKIIPHMYLVYNDRKLCLQFDENFPNEKNSVIINLKNFGWTSVLVWQAEESIILSVTDPKVEKKLNKVQVLGFDHSLASVPISFLAKKLSSCLKYKEKNGEVDIEWVEDAQTRFTKKENDSKMMNEEYIKESLGTQAFYRVWAEEIFINSLRYTVQCLAYHSLMKIVVTLGNKSLEVTPESEAYKFIFSLQTIDIAKNSITLCNSLELRKLINSFFL